MVDKNVIEFFPELEIYFLNKKSNNRSTALTKYPSRDSLKMYTAARFEKRNQMRMIHTTEFSDQGQFSQIKDCVFIKKYTGHKRFYLGKKKGIKEFPSLTLNNKFVFEGKIFLKKEFNEILSEIFKNDFIEHNYYNIY
jgi:hypothetical protein